jgi:predicted metalloprotease with PDZ domain
MILLAAVGLSDPVQGSGPLKLAYHLRLARPSTHLVEVEILAQQVTDPWLDLVMPAWSPGRYAIYDFAKNVQEFQAQGGEGQPLAWSNRDKQTWRVETGAAGGALQVRYKVFAGDLNGTFSQFDTSHANLNGASIYMYVAGHKEDPLSLSVDAPDGWKIFSGYSLSTEERRFSVRSYDILADTPMEVSRECSLARFREAGKTFRIVAHSYAQSSGEVAKLKEAVEKLVRSEMVMMPSPDFEHYTFLFHFAPDIAQGDGMEHLNSTQIIMRGNPTAPVVEEAIEVAALEFFHLWNVKRLRPAALGPFDYTREDYTPSLWFAEGVTNYYAHVHMLRSGLWSPQQFLRRLENEIQQLESEPGRKLMSAESSSFHAWFYDRAPQMQETNFANTTLSYYNKGALLGMLLDLEIRARSRGEKSLDDVMRKLYNTFYESPATTPYGPGRGYEEHDLLDAVNAESGSDFSGFLERYIRGTDPLPYAEALAGAGMELHTGVAPGSAPSLGVLVQPEDRGLRITAVLPGQAADRGGLARDDLLLAVDEQSLATESLPNRLRIYSPGTEVPITLERHGRRERISVRLDPPATNQYLIEESPHASPEQVRVRQGWLGRMK